MMQPYRDVELLIMDFLEAEISDELPAVEPRRVGGVTPVNLEALLSGGFFVQVSLVTGRDDGVTDFGVVDVDVFGLNRTETRDFAERIRAELVSYGGPPRTGLDRVRTETRPRRLPHENEHIWKFGATYNVSARR